MLFELGKNSRCGGDCVQVVLLGLPTGGFWAIPENDVGKLPCTADAGIDC